MAMLSLNSKTLEMLTMRSRIWMEERLTESVLLSSMLKALQEGAIEIEIETEVIETEIGIEIEKEVLHEELLEKEDASTVVEMVTGHEIAPMRVEDPWHFLARMLLSIFDVVWDCVQCLVLVCFGSLGFQWCFLGSWHF